MDHDGQETPFSATAEVDGNRVSVTVTGEVDMATADRMFQVAVVDGADTATIDLTGVTFFDSAAIQALVRISERYPQALEVLASPQVRRVLDISGLGKQPWLKKND